MHWPKTAYDYKRVVRLYDLKDVVEQRYFGPFETKYFQRFIDDKCNIKSCGYFNSRRVFLGKQNRRLILNGFDYWHQNPGVNNHKQCAIAYFLCWRFFRRNITWFLNVLERLNDCREWIRWPQMFRGHKCYFCDSLQALLSLVSLSET